MDSLKISCWMLAGLATALSVTAAVGAQTGTGASAPAQPAGAAQTAPAAQKAPLQLQSLGQQTKADPFPPVNQKYFTATSPSVDTVNAFLKALWGYDPNRIWRVEAIQATPAPNVSKVVVFVSDKSANAKVQPTAFFVTPDGKHAVAGDAVVPFGDKPFADLRKTLQTRADGATRGATSKDLLLVEFADLQCPHCKEAQSTMEQLVKDFPNARVVYQSFPLVDLHPFAYKAAAYGVLRAEAEERRVLCLLGGGVRYSGRFDAGDRRRDAEECSDQGWAGPGRRWLLVRRHRRPRTRLMPRSSLRRRSRSTRLQCWRSTGICCRLRGFRTRR